MGRALSLMDPHVKRAHQLPQLAGLPRIGRGFFCTVFDKGATVMKLTCDPLTYEAYAGPCRLQGIHFPELVVNHGVVGETSSELALYLLEVEKLQPLDGRRHSLARKVMGHHTWESTAKNEDLPDSIREAAQDLANLFQLLGDDAIRDVHYKNLMRRGDTLVFNDVVCDGRLTSTSWDRSGRRTSPTSMPF